ncbi:MAG: hypothetical protein OIF50_14610 [Flavobacteriaceae bacterium]|nr:hypothetical protein [Flavobacteriaceae bacterium]
MQKNIYKLSTIILCTSLVWACSLLQNPATNYAQQTANRTLGAVGQTKSPLLQAKVFKAIGNIETKRAIELNITEVPFNDATRKKYQKHQNYLRPEPKKDKKKEIQLPSSFYEIQIKSIPNLLETLKNKSNKTLRSYLQENGPYEVVTTVRFVPKSQQRLWLTSANVFFMEMDIQGGNRIRLTEKSRMVGDIWLSDLNIFDFETHQLCWNLNYKYQAEIVHLTPSGSSCPEGTEKRAHQLEKESAIKF